MCELPRGCYEELAKLDVFLADAVSRICDGVVDVEVLSFVSDCPPPSVTFWVSFGMSVGFPSCVGELIDTGVIDVDESDSGSFLYCDHVVSATMPFVREYFDCGYVERYVPKASLTDIESKGFGSLLL